MDATTKDATVTQEPSYLGAPYGLGAWLLTKDHKRIAILYLISITIFFAIGGTFAALIRAAKSSNACRTRPRRSSCTTNGVS